MTLDKEDHRKLLLDLIDTTNFPGRFRNVVVELANAIEAAKIEAINSESHKSI